MSEVYKIRDWYYFRFYDRRRANPRKAVALRTKSKTLARKIAAELQRRYLLGEYDPWVDSPFARKKGGHSLTDAAEAFVESRSDLRDDSKRSYKLMIRQLLEEVPGQLAVQDLSEGYLKAYIYSTSVGASSRAHRYRNVKVFVNWLLHQGYIDDNPMRRLAMPKAKPLPPAFFSPSEYARLVSHLDATGRQALADVVAFAVCTGARLGEICAARVGSIRSTPEGLVFAIVNDVHFRTKNGEDRFVALEHDAQGVAERRTQGRSADAPLFTTRRGGAWNPTHLSKTVKAVLRDLGMNERLHFHSLRHSHGSLMSLGGASLLTTKATLGHSDTRMSEHYSQMPESAVRRETRKALGAALPQRAALPQPRSKKSVPRRRTKG